LECGDYSPLSAGRLSARRPPQGSGIAPGESSPFLAPEVRNVNNRRRSAYPRGTGGQRPLKTSAPAGAEKSTEGGLPCPPVTATRADLKVRTCCSHFFLRILHFALFLLVPFPCFLLF